MTVQSLLKNDRAKVITCRPDDTVELVARMLTKNRIGAMPVIDVVVCRPTDHVKDVMAVMARRHIRHLPVVENGELKDMLSQRDVMISRIEQTELEVNVLRDYAIATVAATRG